MLTVPLKCLLRQNGLILTLSFFVCKIQALMRQTKKKISLLDYHLSGPKPKKHLWQITSCLLTLILQGSFLYDAESSSLKLHRSNFSFPTFDYPHLQLGN